MKKRKALLVSNNAEHRQEMENSFNFDKNYTVQTACSGEEVLSLLNDDQVFDFIILQMDDSPSSNLNLLKEIKRKSRNQKVVIITEDQRQTLEIMIRGAIEIVFIPYDKFDLLHRLDDLMRDQRSCKRFELKACDIKIILLNQDGVRLRGVVNNICLDGILVEIDDLEKAKEFFKGKDVVDVLFQPSTAEPLVKIFRGSVVRVFKDHEEKGEMAIYLTPERDIDFLDDFVSYFKLGRENAE